MGFTNSGLPFPLYNEVVGLQAQMLSTMEKCRDKLTSGGGSVDTALTLWFGDNSSQFRKTMKERVARMRGVLNARNIPCKTDAVIIEVQPHKQGSPVQGTKTVGNKILGGDEDENAASTFQPGGIFAGNSVQRMNATGQFIRIGPNFKNLPKSSNGVASSWTGQDKLETLLHELSHFVWDTDDELLNDGTNAYEGQNARLLATQSSARAKNNAENWGFFIEHLGT